MLPWMIRGEQVEIHELREDDLFVHNGCSHYISLVSFTREGTEFHALNMETGEKIVLPLRDNVKVHRATKLKEAVA